MESQGIFQIHPNARPLPRGGDGRAYVSFPYFPPHPACRMRQSGFLERGLGETSFSRKKFPPAFSPARPSHAGRGKAAFLKGVWGKLLSSERSFPQRPPALFLLYQHPQESAQASRRAHADHPHLHRLHLPARRTAPSSCPADQISDHDERRAEQREPEPAHEAEESQRHAHDDQNDAQPAGGV